MVCHDRKEDNGGNQRAHCPGGPGGLPHMRHSKGGLAMGQGPAPEPSEGQSTPPRGPTPKGFQLPEAFHFLRPGWWVVHLIAIPLLLVIGSFIGKGCGG